jgi:hypothetical protein
LALDTAMLTLDSMDSCTLASSLPTATTATTAPAFGAGLPSTAAGLSPFGSSGGGATTTGMGGATTAQNPFPPPVKTGPFFFNDANCYRRLARELGRYAAATMSPNNPNYHVPTDQELQHQARWILYDE